MKNRIKWLAIFLAFGLVLAACSPSESSDTTEGATDTTGAEGTSTTAGGDTTTTAAEMTPPVTDVGVDLEAGTITVGLLSDLTGPFGPLINVINAGMDAYWADVNANGGIGGLEVVLEVRDTGYVVDTHVQMYEELKDQVVAFGHSTGSPHTVAINPQLQADGILAIPLTWYSGWSDPAINANLVPHGVPYCIESMNMIDYMKQQNPDATTIAIASNAGDYGEDSNAGARIAADALGLEIVYDGTGRINAADEATLAEVASGIAGSDADLVWVTTSPTAFGSIYGQAIATGFEAVWSGASPTWNSALVAPDSAIKDPLTRDFYISAPYAPWYFDSPGNQAVRDLMGTYAPDAPPLDQYAEGVIEATILRQALDAAYANGDLTQQGVLDAAKSLESVSFDGLAPDQSYVGEPNDIVVRAQWIGRPDPAGLADGTSTGVETIESNYISPTAEAFEFNEACYSIG